MNLYEGFNNTFAFKILCWITVNYGDLMEDYIFRAYDIRGKVPDDLDAEGAYRIGLSLANLYPSTTLSYDIRKTSPSLALAFLAGFLEGGGDLAFQGQASFGTAMFAGWKEDRKTTTYITASHLPPEYNGVKNYYSDGVGFYEDDLAKLKSLALGKVNRKTWREYGSYTAVDYKDEYINFFSSRYNLTGLKIGVDCGGGAVSLVAEDLFNAVNSSPRFIYSKPNPALSDRSSEPSPDALGDLKELVVSNGLDMGVGFDGDGDRVTVVDRNGRFLTPEQLAVIIAKDIGDEKGGGKVVANVECSMALEKALNPVGIEVVRIPVGHTYMTHYVKKLDALLGVEASGHFIIPSVLPFDDAIPVVMEIARIAGNDLSKEIDSVPVYPKKRIKIPVEERKKESIMLKLKEKIASEYERVNTMDGIRIDFGDSWVLIRKSNTEPLIRVTVEASDNEKLDELIKKFRSLVEAEK